MRVFTLFLIAALAFVGISLGYRFVAGKDLVSLGGPAQAEVDVPATSATPATVPRPAPLATLPAATPTKEADPEPAYETWWVQNHMETDLWSGADDGAVSFGKVPQWSYFLVVAPQEGPRLYVFNPVTQNYAYIDAAAVGPGSAPSN